MAVKIQLYFYRNKSIESNGIPVVVTTVDPSGKAERSYNSGGIAYTVVEAKLKGAYQIWVATQEENAMGEYKMDVVGKFNSEPVLLSVDHKAIEDKFTDASKHHEYTIPVTKLGIMEVIYRSTSTGASITLSDEYGKQLRTFSNDSPTPRLVDVSYKIERVGNYMLSVKTDQPTVGDYELLFWGNFDNITKQPDEPDQQGSGIVSGELTSTAPVIMKGRVLSRSKRVPYNEMSVAFEDLNNGLTVGRMSPNAQGEYSFRALRGARYGITVLPSNGIVANSQNMDLTRPGPGEVNVPVIEVFDANVGAVVNLNNIFFETGKYQLLPTSFGELRRVADFMQLNPNLRVEVAGYTDNVGSESDNKSLSKERATAVMNYFLGQRISAARLSAVGYGSAKPVTSNDTEAGRQQNRRVEFRIVGK